MSEAHEFQAAVKQNVQQALAQGVDPFLAMSILDCARMDLYMNLRQAAQRQVKREDIIRAGSLPPNFPIKPPQPPNGHQ